MDSPFPDEDTVRSALMLAVCAPSVHNSQPWRWQVGEQSVQLHANRDLHLPHTDPDARDLMLSCGVALNHCQVAFAALGWQAKIRRFPDDGDPNLLADMTFHRHRASDSDIALAAAIPRRRTDRRHFSSRHVSVSDVALMGSRAARAGVTLRRVADLAHLRRIVAEAAWRHAADYGYSAELATWSGRYGATAGVPARNTPEPDARSVIPARWFAGAALAQPPDDDDTAMVIALGTAADDDVSRLRAGEATSSTLLTATAIGLATCPITEPLEVAETRALVRSDVFDGRSHPQMLLRIGWAPVDSDPLPCTPRRRLADVATRADGSAFG